jgi:glycine/D-amino acid oxidase-like deaminating enzyme
MQAAIACGAVVRPRTNVSDIVVEGEKVTGVLTDTGQISSGSVVDACGAWAALFSARAGFPLPMAPVRSHYWISEPNPSYGGEHPITILSDVGAYTRPEVGGILLRFRRPIQRHSMPMICLMILQNSPRQRAKNIGMYSQTPIQIWFNFSLQSKRRGSQTIFLACRLIRLMVS